ncbi:hypothetical protein [Brachybacterium muris]|uniref:hypothetical protein n=1 Tax=Brachybacterium muris TaxID=219301 RepID=UPI00034DACE1|nr:hypothetical protein [Brachybacterium muris]MCT1655704.1 hypothetical protein [Brachybacterium muris]
MSVVLDDPRATDLAPTPERNQDRALTSPGEDLDPVIVAARAAGRRAGKRLARSPLTSRQRAVVTSVMGGAR